MRCHVFQKSVCIVPLSYHMLIIVISSGTVVTDNPVKVQKIQMRALRVILNDYESIFDDLIEKTGQSLMFAYRLRSIVLVTFKSVTKLNPHFCMTYSMLKTMCTIYEVDNYWINPELMQKKYGIHAVRYQGVRLWNSLPSYMKMSNSIEEYNSHLASLNGPGCTCGYCLPCKLSQI